MNYPSNWDKAESEYQETATESCPNCRAQDSFEQDEDDDGRFWVCTNCGKRVEMQ